MRWGETIQRVRAFLLLPTPTSRACLVLLITSLVFLLEKMLHVFAMFDGGWAVWWPTNGITLALLLMARRRHWPWILLGTTLGTGLGMSQGPDPVSEMVSNAFSNLVEVIIPALILPQFKNLTEWLQQPRLLRNFVCYGLLLAPALSSLMAALYFHLVLQSSFWEIVLRWGVADIVGIVMFTPLVLALVSPETYALFQPRELPATLGTILLLVITSWLIFYHTTLPIAFVVSPIVLLVAIRLGFSGSVLAINLLAPIATYATLHGWGPFAFISSANAPYRVIVVQVFLVLALLMAFPISVARVRQQSTAMQLQLAYLEMEALATADTLTGLANRRRFDAALAVEWRRALREQQPIAVLMLDADNFKTYYDCYGHPTGDICLRSIATAICDIPQRGSDLVARYGGEEFVVLLPGIDGNGAYNVAELVRSNVQLLNLPHEGNASGRVTLSIGCASITPRDDLDSAVLMEASDRALYVAKHSGRDRVHLCTDAEMLREIRTKMRPGDASDKAALSSVG